MQISNIQMNDELSVESRLIQLLVLSIKASASDLHLAANHPPILRIDGDLVYLSEFPILAEHTLKPMVYTILDEQQKSLLESQREIDFALMLPEIGRFRVNVFHQLHGLAAVFRLVPLSVPTLDSLNAPAVIKQVLNLDAGLVLVTGPTGCGKSTTLAAMIEFINLHFCSHVLTIEDPIEFVYTSKKSLIQQRQIYRDALSFDAALRAALREDPDVILIGELRDLETIRLALNAAETGHLVMATLHTSSASGAISRLIDVFPLNEKSIVRHLLAESLQAVMCQRLLKRIHGGRTAAFEMMLATPAIRHLIREDKTAQLYSVMQTGSLYGMCTMEQSVANLVNKNIAVNSELSKNIPCSLC